MCLPGVDSTPNELGTAGKHLFKLIPIHCCAPVPWTLVQNGTGDKDQPYPKPGPRKASGAPAVLLPEDPGAREKCELTGPCALKERGVSRAGERTLAMSPIKQAKSRILGDDGEAGTGAGLLLGAGVEILVPKLLPA